MERSYGKGLNHNSLVELLNLSALLAFFQNSADCININVAGSHDNTEAVFSCFVCPPISQTVIKAGVQIETVESFKNFSKSIPLHSL